MKLFLKYTLTFALFLGASNIFAQQNPVMTHYTLNPYLYNAAQVGESGFLSFNAHYRKQWVNMPDAPDTKLMTAQAMLKNKYGIGAKVYIDQAHIVNNYGALFSYAYYIRTKKNPDSHYFSIGLSAGFKSQRLRFNEATIKDDFDSKIMYDGASNTVFDAEAGVNYRMKGLKLAAFVSNIAPHSYNYRRSNNSLEYRPSYHVYGSAGYDIAIGDNFTIKPSMLVRYIPKVPVQFDANLLLDWKNQVWLGGGYRYKNAGLWATVGFRVHDMVAFNYSYEQSIDGYQAALGSTHEMSIEFRFIKKDKDLEKDLDDRFRDMKSKMLVKNQELLDSIQEVKDQVADLANELDSTNNQLTILKENNNTTVYKGNEVKYAAVGKVNFFLNSATIHKEQKVEADAIYEFIKEIAAEDKLILIRIEGSASIEGSETYNLILSNKRNEAMINYLIEKGINADLITTSSKGNANAMIRDNAYEDKDAVTPDPEDRYVKVYILYND